MERRYLLDLLAQIEAADGDLGDELFVASRRMAATGSRRTAKPLSLLVKRGMLAVSTKDGTLRGVLTKDGCRLIHGWFATKPPDFTKRFPRLCHQLRIYEEAPDRAGDDAMAFSY
jgi:hypothetical protein